MRTVVIRGYESAFKNMLKTVSSSDSEYNKLMEKCTNKPDYIEDNAYHIDAEGFLHFKHRIYVPNQGNIKQIIFRELHDNHCVGHRGYHKLITT